MSRPTVLAAGGVLWRDDASDPQVALVRMPKYDDWSLPKGTARAGDPRSWPARSVTGSPGHTHFAGKKRVGRCPLARGHRPTIHAGE